MREIPDRVVTLILTDLPYGITQNDWDSVIPLDKLWAEYKRILVPNGAIVLTASQPFTTKVIASNFEMFKYCWVWKKGTKPTGFLNAKKQPLRITEDVVVFYREQCKYHPQMTIGEVCHKRGKTVNTDAHKTTNYGKYVDVNTEGDMKYPLNLIDIPRDVEKVHPTQKPVALFEYLIRTYTDEGDVVLDSCLGSGTTLKACMSTNRIGLGFEIDPTHEPLIKSRIAQGTLQMTA